MSEIVISVGGQEQNAEIAIAHQNSSDSINVEHDMSRYYSEITEYYANQAKEIAQMVQDVVNSASIVTLDGIQIITGDKFFRGNLIALTPETNDNSEKVATTAFVKNAADSINTITDGKLELKADKSTTIEGYGITDAAKTDLSNLTTAGESHFATTSLSNISSAGINRMNVLKGYSDAGELLTDAEGLADVQKYAHSTFDINKFTKVGSPTITDDGIASGFSSGNGISIADKVPFTQIASTDVFEISIDTYFPTTFSGYKYLLRMGGCSIYLDSTNLRVNYNGYATLLSLAYMNAYSGKNVRIICTIDGINSLLKCSVINLENGTKSSNSAAITPANISVDTTFILGENGVNSWAMSIDLKQFLIKIGGVPVFSGNKTGTDTYTINSSTVTIPYTLSKTGSKIVDSAYRTQVSSVYNEFGYAPYYTLDEDGSSAVQQLGSSVPNYTLPQGELYGMYNKALSGAMPDYANGITISALPYTVPDNGYIDIAISAVNGTNELFNNNIKIGHAYASTSNYYSMISGQYRVKKGDVITNSGHGGLQWGAFFPLMYTE